MRLLVVFTRHPEPGAVKTRLIPRLGARGAAALHRSMAERTLRRVAGAADRLEVRFTGCGPEEARNWLGAGQALAPQGEGDLGERLARAVGEGFGAGARAVAVVGTDCPDLGADDVREAFAALERADVVLGPAADGGYWLVGVGAAAWERGAGALFAAIPWGTGGVLEASRGAARAAGLEVALLRTLADVDRPEDLATWERAVSGEGRR